MKLCRQAPPSLTNRRHSASTVAPRCLMHGNGPGDRLTKTLTDKNDARDPMRLTDEQRRIIVEETAHIFGAGARVRLFGSRVDDSARGGDIDLYVEVDQALPNRAATASRLAARLQLILGEQRIDIVLVDPNTTPQTVHAVARHEGIAL